MIGLILIALCAWRLHHLAKEKGLSPWLWIAHFFSGFFAFFVILSIVFLMVYGEATAQDYDKTEKLITPWTPFILLFMVLWFIFLQNRLSKHKPMDHQSFDDNDQYFPDLDKEPKPEKKDLSYFR